MRRHAPERAARPAAASMRGALQTHLYAIRGGECCPSHTNLVPTRSSPPAGPVSLQRGGRRRVSACAAPCAAGRSADWARRQTRSEAQSRRREIAARWAAARSATRSAVSTERRAARGDVARRAVAARWRRAASARVVSIARSAARALSRRRTHRDRGRSSVRETLGGRWPVSVTGAAQWWRRPRSAAAARSGRDRAEAPRDGC